MNITQVGIDLAKLNFQVHGVDARGKVAQQAGLLTFTEGIVRVVTNGGVANTKIGRPRGSRWLGTIVDSVVAARRSAPHRPCGSQAAAN
jgi:hypothetical protein